MINFLSQCFCFIDLNPTMIDIWTYQNRNSHSNSGNENWTPSILVRKPTQATQLVADVNHIISLALNLRYRFVSIVFYCCIVYNGIAVTQYAISNSNQLSVSACKCLPGFRGDITWSEDRVIGFWYWLLQ